MELEADGWERGWLAQNKNVLLPEYYTKGLN